MAPSPAYANTVRATIVNRLWNRDVAENVIHFIVEAGATITQAWAEDLISQLATAWTSHLQGITSTTDTFESVKVQDLRTVPYPTFVANVDEDGTEATNPLPANLAACISLRTDHPGRRGRGRMYIAGLCEDSNSATGTIEATTVDALNAFANAIEAIVEVGGDSVQFAVLSRTDGAAYPVIANQVDSRWDSQQRRNNGR